jgi:hypothetical protein
MIVKHYPGDGKCEICANAQADEPAIAKKQTTTTDLEALDNEPADVAADKTEIEVTDEIFKIAEDAVKNVEAEESSVEEAADHFDKKGTNNSTFDVLNASDEALINEPVSSAHGEESESVKNDEESVNDTVEHGKAEESSVEEADENSDQEAHGEESESVKSSVDSEKETDFLPNILERWVEKSAISLQTLKKKVQETYNFYIQHDDFIGTFEN